MREAGFSDARVTPPVGAYGAVIATKRHSGSGAEPACASLAMPGLAYGHATELGGAFVIGAPSHPLGSAVTTVV
jgi:hypothetical protein